MIKDPKKSKHWRFKGVLKAKSALIGLGLFVLVLFPAIHSAGSENNDLTELSLEDLMNVTITSASKKSQLLSEAPAAVFVVTREDIHRSGATSIPEALRMVPGLQVAKIDANKWAITARGSNGRFANKLLVLMDGRSVYTPLYSGVFWENIDTVLEDIDRIEVIRGPGASLWGANAVNGVINIITRSAAKTQGILASGIAGNEERGNVSLRYGGRIGPQTPFRLYVKGFERDAAVDAAGEETADDWRYLRGGFRIDHQHGNRDSLTLQGDLFDGTNGETLALPSTQPPYLSIVDSDHEEQGYNLVGRWTRTLSSQSEISLQAYYDHNEHRLHVGKSEEDAFDIEFQHRFPLADDHDVTWGLGYRLYRDDFAAAPTLTEISPLSRSVNIFNGFLQDEIGFFDKRLRLTLGSKFEYNDYTRWEIQPNARLLYKPSEKHSIWTAVSRAVRTPARVERDTTALLAVMPPSPETLPVAIVYQAADHFESERLTAYELGYRVQATAELAFDSAVYYNEYKGLRETATGIAYPEGLPPTHVVLPVSSTNDTEGSVYGVELAVDWRPMEWFRLQPAYTYMENDIDYNANDVISAQDPRHQFSLRTSVDLPHDIQFDLWYRNVAAVSDAVDGYHTIDARIAWKYSENLKFSVVGQNLIDGHHPEIQPEALHTVGTEVERGIYAKIVWQFE